jgi:broad specificity phosphatase PhoE
VIALLRSELVQDELDASKLKLELQTPEKEIITYLSAIYFIRHAQAGTRDNYDYLSDLGREQVNRLQQYLAREEIKPAAVFSGRPRRQQETSMCVGGVTAIDEAWNEFQLSSLYRSLSERLTKDLDGFAADYQEMASALALDPHTTRGAVGRCDQTVIRAWIENRYPDYDEQTWPGFKNRVVEGLDRLRSFGAGERILVFTSATPIAIAAGIALGLTDERILSLMSVLYNTGITTIRLSGRQTSLFTFNGLPHLSDPAMRTFR